MRFVKSTLMFLLVFVGCVAIFGAIIGILYLWCLGLFWTTSFGFAAPIAYLTTTICIMPAIAITHSVLED